MSGGISLKQNVRMNVVTAGVRQIRWFLPGLAAVLVTVILTLLIALSGHVQLVSPAGGPILGVPIDRHQLVSPLGSPILG